MENQFKVIGRRIQEIRQVLEISVAEMAKVTGITEEEYLKHENGVVESSFSFIMHCAERLGVDLSSIVSGESPKLSFYNITRKSDGLPIERREELEYRHLAPMLKNRHAEPLFVKARPLEDESMPIPLSTHTGHEFDYVLSGSLKLQLGDKIEILNPGDSAFYDSSYPHGMVSVDSEGCEFLAIVMKSEADTPYVETPVIEKDRPKVTRKLIYQDFVKETLDENGFLKGVKFEYPDNFNFTYDVVDVLAERHPDKVAMQWMGNDHSRRTFTFKDISELSCQAANYLYSLGIRKGDRVMMVLRRNYQFWILQNALHRIGAVSVLATSQLKPHDFEYRFERAGVKCIICSADGDILESAEEATKKCPNVQVKIAVNGTRLGWRNFDEELDFYNNKFKRPEDLKATDLMLMFFSSGTTGYPKIVAHSFTYPLGHATTARWWQNVDPDGLHLTISDTGWAKAMWGKLYGQWLNEAAVMVYDFDRFDASDIMRLFKDFKLTTFCAPPTMYRFLIREDLGECDFSSLKYTTIAGEALNPEVFQQFYKASGLKMMEGFGQTETTAVIANITGMTPKPGSMGKPNPQYEVELFDNDGKPVKTGDVGEIVIKAEPHQVPGLFLGYYNDPEATANAWHDGYYHTGDTAWRDEDGYYWYVGRIDDLIKSSGYRIGPFEIESTLMELPYVLECAVIGVPDETRGQVVKAYIVLTRDKQPSEELKKEIQNYVKNNTAPYKYPRIIEFAESLPKTPSGKIRRTELRNLSK